MGIISRLLHRMGLEATKDHSAHQSVPVPSIPGFTPSKEAKRQILNGEASAGLVTDNLKFDRDECIIDLPEDLTVRFLRVQNCPNFKGLPPGLWAGGVTVDGCATFSRINPDIHVSGLSISNCPHLTTLPSGLKMHSLSVENCPNLSHLPDTFHFKRLNLPGSRIEHIPDAAIIDDVLNLRGSSRLKTIPSISLTELDLRGCTNFESLPDRLEADALCLSGCVLLRWQESACVEVRHLDISDCVQITHLPDWLDVSYSIDVANTGLTALPKWLKCVNVLWRGVKVDQRIAFHPEDIRCDEVIAETNVERRRVMLERIGWENFLAQVEHEILDSDTDPGGERRLMKFRFDDGEELRVLAVCCPSTERRYFIRVPPQISQCHAAAAWVAGFDDPDDYRPIKET
jgi:hypothetical protein